MMSRSLLSRCISRSLVSQINKIQIRSIYVNQNKPDNVEMAKKDMKKPGTASGQQYEADVKKAKSIENEVNMKSSNDNLYNEQIPNLEDSDPIFGDHLSYQHQMNSHNAENQKPQHTGSASQSSSQNVDTTEQFNQMKDASKKMEWSMRGGPSVEVGAAGESTDIKTSNQNLVSDIETDPQAFKEDNLGKTKRTSNTFAPNDLKPDRNSLAGQLQDVERPKRHNPKQTLEDSFNEQQVTTSSEMGEYSIENRSFNNDNLGTKQSTSRGKVKPAVPQKGPSGYGISDERDEKKRTV